MLCHGLTDREWELFSPLIPQASTGRPRADDRQVVNGMVYKIRTGVSWRDLPECYGPWQTVYSRFRRYVRDGVFTEALHQILAHTGAADDIDWLMRIDSMPSKPVKMRRTPAPKRGFAGGAQRTNEPLDR